MSHTRTRPDFGLAKIATGTDDQLSLSGGQAVIGTPAYMSPEQACGDAVDHRADLYSTGVILYQLLSGQVPFQAATQRQLIMKHVSQAPPALATTAPDLELPDGLEAVVSQALAKEPDDRFQTAEQFRYALEFYSGDRKQAHLTAGALAAQVTVTGSQATQDIVGSLVGATIDRYKIVAPIGEGGMGTVYLAEHTHMHRQVAVKVIKGDVSRDPELISRFQREAQVSARFKHPSAVEVYDFSGFGDNMFFMAMELIEGDTLTDRLRPLEPLPLRDVIEIASQVLDVLGAAHEAGIVHRDLKPDNVMLKTVDGWANQVKVLDFGVAKLREVQGEAARFETQQGSFCGTPMYASPEQCGGDAVDHRADLYTVAVILYELLVGRAPFISETLTGYLGQHMAAEPPAMAEVNPNAQVAPVVEAVIHKALAKKRDDRHADAAAFKSALQEAAGIFPVFASGSKGVYPTEARVVRTSGWLRVAVGVLVIALLLIGVGYLTIDPGAVVDRNHLVQDQANAVAAQAAAKEAGAASLDGAGYREAIALLEKATQRLDGDLIDAATQGLFERADAAFRGLEKSAVDARTAAEHSLATEARTAAEAARAAAVKAGAEQPPAELFSAATVQFQRGEDYAVEGKWQAAQINFNLALSTFGSAAEKAAEALVNAAERTEAIEALREAVGRVAGEAEAAGAEAFAATTFDSAREADRAAKAAASKGDLGETMECLKTAQTMYAQARDGAKQEFARRVAAANADIDARERAAVAAFAETYAPSAFAAYSARRAVLSGQMAADAVSRREALHRLEALAADLARVADRARFGKQVAGLETKARAAEAASGTARDAAVKVESLKYAPVVFRGGEAKRAVAGAGRATVDAFVADGAEEVPESLRERVLEAIGQVTTNANAATLAFQTARNEAISAKAAIVQAAARASAEAELAAQRAAARGERLVAMEAALERAATTRAGYTQALAVAKAKGANTTAAERVGGPGVRRLGEAQAQAAGVRAGSPALAEIDAVAQFADRARAELGQARVLAEAASAAADSAAAAAASDATASGGPSAAIAFRLSKFRKAMQAKNLAALKRCFASMPTQTEKGYGQLFRNDRVRIEVKTFPPVLLDDDEAEALFELTVIEGSRRGKASKAKLILGPFGGGWKIVEITAP